MNVITATQPAEAPVVPPSSSTAANTRNVAMNAKVGISFLNSFTDAKLLVAVAVIIQSMTGNPSYPSPLPTLAAITAAHDSYAAAVNAAKDRGKLALAQRDRARAILVQLVRELALYVQRICGGDPVVLISSGFTAWRDRRKPVGVLGVPQNVRLRPARLSGQLLARCDRVASALTYQWRYASALTPTAWTQADPVSTASYSLEGLTAGASYLVQVRVFGTSGPSNWSDSATAMSL